MENGNVVQDKFTLLLYRFQVPFYFVFILNLQQKNSIIYCYVLFLGSDWIFEEEIKIRQIYEFGLISITTGSESLSIWSGSAILVDS